MTDRQQWLKWMLKITDPVIRNLANEKLRQTMPIEAKEEHLHIRERYTYLEAFGRSLAGMAPWLDSTTVSDSEEALRNEYGDLVRKAIRSATDPCSKDFMNFCEGNQPVVDIAFLAHAIVRAPKALAAELDNTTRSNLVAALKSSRKIKPHFNNWLLFSAMVEAGLFILGEEVDRMRIDYAIRQHLQWYKGDGVFGDGPAYHHDYYNSYVIQPMLYDLLQTVGHLDEDWKKIIDDVKVFGARYAAVLERMISPEGTYPPLGRSLAYRVGTFQHLAQMALVHNLPEEVHPAQVRSALTAVINRSLAISGTFDENGWLQIGVCGHQPSIGEKYISTGSLYLCSTVFLPLGLSEEDDFWQGKHMDWTSKKIWSSVDMTPDHALDKEKELKNK